MTQVNPRQRRKTLSRRKIAELGAVRLSVHKTPKHIYAQVFSSDGASVVASASSLEKAIKEAKQGSKGKVPTAAEVGALVATRAKEKGVNRVAFDRSGFKYHGRIKALAEAARKNGLEF